MTTHVENGNAIWREAIKESLGNIVISSELCPVTEKELRDAFVQHQLTGKCLHGYVFDTAGYLYDTRICAVCGQPRGLV